jgi:hypothetical protein
MPLQHISTDISKHIIKFLIIQFYHVYSNKFRRTIND